MVLSKRERNIGIISGLALGVLLINYVVIDPLMAAKDDVDRRIVEATGTLNNKKTLVRRAQEEASRWNEISRSGLLRDSSPAETQILGAVSSWAREAGKNPPPSLRTDRTDKEGKYFYKVTIHATGNGNMQQIARFLWHFETANIPVRVNELTISSRKDGQDDLQLAMTISTIYLAPENDQQNKTVAMATGVQP